MGQARSEFESAFREAVGATAARATGMGREALYVALRALGIGEGDRVGLPAYTCLAVVEPVLLAGAVPVFLDIDSYATIDPSALELLAPGALKAVVLQHTFGVPGRVLEIVEQSRRIGAAVVEDCAHVFGSSSDGVPLGRLGDAAVWSLGWSKPMPLGSGGVVTANSVELAGRIDAELERLANRRGKLSALSLGTRRRIHRASEMFGAGLGLKRLYGELTKRGFLRETFETRGPAYCPPGYVKLMDEPTARAGLRLLAEWPRIRERRRDGAEVIRARLAERRLPTWPVPCRADVTMLVYPVLAPNKPALLDEAHRRSLDVGGWYESPVHPAPRESWPALGYEPGSCPWGEELGRHVVHIPTDSPALDASLDFLIHRLTRSRPPRKRR